MLSPLEDAGVDPGLRSALARLTVDPDGAEFIVARPDRGIYVAIPAPGVVLIEALRDGASMPEATARASAAAGEEVDVSDFLTGLGEAGLLDGADHATANAVVGSQIRWLDRIPARAVAPLFGRAAWVIYTAATLTALGLLLARPDLRPIFDDVWFLTNPIWSMLVMFVVSAVITMGHECWHWLAGRALGVTARFRVSWRGVFIVFESDLSPLVTVARRARYSPLLAGFAFDFTVLAASLLMRLGFRDEWLTIPADLDRFLGAVIFRQVVVIIWQLSGVAFRSDSYAILANALGCHNLFRATTLTVKRGLWRLDSQEVRDLAELSVRDRRAAGWFWMVYVAGGFFMFWVMFTYVVPFSYGMIEFVGPNIGSGAVTTLVFWQSLLLALLIVAQYAVVPFIARRERKARPPRVADPVYFKSSDRIAWQTMFSFLVVFALVLAFSHLQGYFGVSFSAASANAAAAKVDDSCLPGRQVPILDFPHISQQALASVVYNSNPPTSGPHYGAAVAPGIYHSYLPSGVTVHSMEHGRVVIHYRPDTPVAVVRELESVAKQFARDTVMHPNPTIDSPIVLTAWGRIDSFDRFDRAAIVDFVDTFRNRYNHRSTITGTECASRP